MAERAPITVDASDARVELLLALADDELIIGHRLSEWTGWVPYLEGDLAFSSIAQDELGHARALYGLAVGLGAAADEDALALGRAPEGYRHAAICARANGDFATSLARHWLYDRADRVRLDALRAGSWRELGELLRVIELEETFHRAHADAWFRRLLDGPIEARRRFGDALVAQLGLLHGFFDPIDGEQTLLDTGVQTLSSKEQGEAFFAEVLPILDAEGLDVSGVEHVDLVPTSSGAAEASVAGPDRDGDRGGRHGVHEETFTELWAEMTALYRSDDEAAW